MIDRRVEHFPGVGPRLKIGELVILFAGGDRLRRLDVLADGCRLDAELDVLVLGAQAWPQLWEDIKAARPSLVIVDPVSAALADADTSQTGPARTFLRLLSQEAATADCGVLLVAHDTKSARNLAMAGHGPGHAGGPIEPAPLLAIYDAGGAAAGNNNPAAPLASRIWLEGVLDVMPCDRSRGPVSLPPITTKELIKRLYPDHPGRRQSAKWRPNRMLPALLEALDLVDRHRVPVLDREGHRTFWRIVSVTGRPGEHLDDALHLHVHFPAGSERGPLIDRHAVRIAGARSSAAWRLALSLSFRWHDPGRLILPVGNDRKWRQTRKPARYPEVSAAELLVLTFPAGYPDRKRDALTRAEAALSYLLKIGYAAVHPRRRIMPGKTWAGWNVPSG